MTATENIDAAPDSVRKPDIDLYAFLNAAFRRTGDGVVPVKPTKALVNDVLDGLKARVNLHLSSRAPTWLGQAPVPADEIVSCCNGLLHLPSGQLLPHTPEFFSHNVLDFDYDPDAPPPVQWLTFLKTLWPEDVDQLRPCRNFLGSALQGRPDIRRHSAAERRLRVLFVISSNELPQFDERSGGLAGRFIVLTMTRSFYGREDLGLTEKLLAELPGTLSWAIAGWKRLSKRGFFVQPKTGTEAASELEDLSSPIRSFVKERCVVAPEQNVECGQLYKAWGEWNESKGGCSSVLPSNLFSRNLRAAVAGLSVSQPRRDGKQVRVFEGIGLR